MPKFTILLIPFVLVGILETDAARRNQHRGASPVNVPSGGTLAGSQYYPSSFAPPQKYCLTNGRPDVDFKNLSKAAARRSSTNCTSTTICQGVWRAVCGDSPALCEARRDEMSAVRPMYCRSGSFALRMM